MRPGTLPIVLEVQSGVALIISIALFAVKAFALVDCIGRPAARFPAVGSLPKNTWLVVLVLAVLTHVFVSQWDPIGIFSLVGTVAALVYLAQVRGSQ